VILRWLLFPVHWSFAGYFVLQILHGATFGAAHLGVMHSISRRVPDAQTGRAQATYFFISGVMMAFMTIISGQLFVHLGANSFAVMALLGALAVVLWLLMQRLERQQSSTP
jgi:PPP family 3-phenylpropionic acid transporter